MADDGGGSSAGGFGARFRKDRPKPVASRLVPALSGLDVWGLDAAGKMALDARRHLLLDSRRS